MKGDKKESEGTCYAYDFEDGIQGINNYKTICAFMRGDRDVVNDIVKIYRDGLIWFVNSYIHNLHSAEDIVSDTFVRLISKKPRIKNLMYFKTYLFNIARNITLDYIRKNKRKRDIDIEITNSYDNRDDVEELICRNEEDKILAKCLLELCEEYRTVLSLYYFEEMSIDAIAMVMNRNKKQIYNLIQRAKSALREILKEEDFCFEKL